MYKTYCITRAGYNITAYWFECMRIHLDTIVDLTIAIYSMRACIISLGNHTSMINIPGSLGSMQTRPHEFAQHFCWCGHS